MLAVIENIATASTAKPQKAKELLRGVVESILMTATPDGYDVRIELKRLGPAAVLGDRAEEDYVGSCGGAISPRRQTVGIALSSEVLSVRGASSPSAFVRVREPRLIDLSDCPT